MRNKEIRDRAIQIIKNDIVPFLIVGFIYGLVDQIMKSLGSGMLIKIFTAVADSVISASSACFYMRAFNRGTPNIGDMYEIFTYKDDLNKMFSIMTLLFIINLAGQVIMSVVAFIPLINIIAVVVILIIGYLLNLVWYLFVTNSHYPTENYVKASIRYMGNYGFDYIRFTFVTAILPAIIVGVVGVILPPVGTLLSIPMNVYIGLATAGYVSTVMIPNEWYSGLARF